MKRQPLEWEKIIANDTSDKGLTSKLYNQLNTRKTNKPIKNWVEDLNHTSLQRRHESESVSGSDTPDSSVTPWTTAHQAPLSMGFTRQEYWSGVPFPSPGDLPSPGIELASPALHEYSLPAEPHSTSLPWLRRWLSGKECACKAGDTS